ncbi:uncharacterized protein LOC144631837 [Oculina patagonica]
MGANRKKRKQRNTGSPPSKTSKMSASPGSASADESGEAVSNKEIWKILKTIQENTDQLLKENKDLKEQYAELRTSLEFHVEKLEKVEKENVNLKTEVTRLQNALNKEADQVSKLRNDLKATNSNLDDLEQYTRKYNLEFHDFPEEDDENIAELIIKLGNLLNVKIAKGDIDICHRMAQNPRFAHKPRPIIVRFRSYRAKKELYSARKQLRRIDVNQVFPGTTQVFINENLTKSRRQLFGKARKAKDDKEWHSAWTIDGKIFIKRSVDERPIRILKAEDLNIS